jgi:glycerol-3-phosphate dehydrogenase
MEPSANPDIIGAVKVPDGAVDPFRLTSANVIDAKLHGAKVLVYSEVTNLIKDGDTVKGVEVFNHITKQTAQYYAPITVNAGGIWGQHIAELAGVKINMFPAKGALLIFGHRVNNVVLNRCRKPANADILVPGDTICLIGTTSSRIPFEECDNMFVTPDEVDVLLQEGEKLAPSLASTRILRAYAGVRPLVATDDDPSGRNISRGIVLLDHETRDGVKGFISITGGKLMTYRLMAEWAADLVCKKLGVQQSCITMNTPLPGSERENIDEISHKTWSKPGATHKATVGRHGARAVNIGLKDEYDASLVCECEEVSVGEVKYAIDELDVHNLVDLRRRTRVGMGTCQGELCACRAAGMLADAHKCTDRAKNDLKNFVNERWKGMYPICWGDTLRESEYSQWIYSGVCGLEGGECETNKAE